MKYICIAKCPELYCEGIDHCEFEAKDEVEAFSSMGRECPCGN